MGVPSLRSAPGLPALNLNFSDGREFLRAHEQRVGAVGPAGALGYSVGCWGSVKGRSSGLLSLSFGLLSPMPWTQVYVFCV